MEGKLRGGKGEGVCYDVIASLSNHRQVMWEGKRDWEERGGQVCNDVITSLTNHRPVTWKGKGEGRRDSQVCNDVITSLTNHRPVIGREKERGGGIVRFVMTSSPPSPTIGQ